MSVIAVESDPRSCVCTVILIGRPVKPPASEPILKVTGTSILPPCALIEGALFA